VLTQDWYIGRGYDGKIHVLGKVVSDSVETVNPRGTHRTWLSLLLPVHEVIDDQRPIGQSEQLAQADRLGRSVTGIQV
jgi:hypothetical protein